ncbi:hypothetical protein OIU77_015378 [Salix suchowensis]|uniref:Uncharacterized protein n=1 Tax=Salix suchowensis TaxID=1278906 RepID=A0ABQ8ZGU6_9ROSI|nr:hypothetical protein OIU77_015378 [Salix suchowensis]
MAFKQPLQTVQTRTEKFKEFKLLKSNHQMMAY